MKSRILLIGFLFLNLGIFNATAQNNSKPAPKSQTAPKLPVSTSEKPPEQIEYEKAFKSLNSAQKSKFDQVNRDFFKKMMDAVNDLNSQANRIGKISSPLAIINRIFPSHNQQNANSTPYNENSNKIFQQYSKLTPNQQRLIKLEIIKFRKISNQNEQDRATKMKAIFKKDFIIFKASESAGKIEEDEKLLSVN